MQYYDHLCSQDKVLYSTLRTLINEIFELERFDSEKLAKYMRCLLRVVLPDADLSLRVIDEICRIIKQAAEVSLILKDYKEI